MKRYAALVLAIAMAGASAAAAQQSSPVADLLAGARNALNDLQYWRADSIARSLLSLGGQLSGAERSQTYQLLAAAAYPEERAAQRPVSAEQYLRRLLQLDPTATMSRDVTWPGLDSLLEETRRSTFAVRVVPLVDTVRAGRETTDLFQVRATRPASLTLAADNEGGSVVELDREGPVNQAMLSIEAVDGDRAILRSGSYTFWITARDPIRQEEVKFAFDVRVQAPRLELAHVPVTIDSSLFLPEQAVPRRTRNALIGIALGATTALAATTFVGSDELSGVSSSGQAYAVAGMMTLGALVGTFLEKPRPIPENIVHNEQVRADFAEAVRSAAATNAARRRDYRVTIVIVGEMR